MRNQVSVVLPIAISSFPAILVVVLPRPEMTLCSLLARNTERLGGLDNRHIQFDQAPMSPPDGASSSSPCLPRSMIIYQIHIDGIAVLKAEDDPPIGANRGSPITLKIAFQLTQPKRSITGMPQRSSQHAAPLGLFDFANTFRVYASSLVILEELPLPLMRKTINDRSSVPT